MDNQDITCNEFEKTAELCYKYAINDLSRQKIPLMSFYLENIFEDNITICGINLCKCYQKIKNKIKYFLCEYTIKNDVIYYSVNQESVNKLNDVFKVYFSKKQSNVDIHLDHVITTEPDSPFYFNFDKKLDFPFPPVYVVVSIKTTTIPDSQN